MLRENDIVRAKKATRTIFRSYTLMWLKTDKRIFPKMQEACREESNR